MLRLDPEFLKQYHGIIAEQLSNLSGEKALLHSWESPDPTYYSLETQTPRPVSTAYSSYLDPTRSGGVHALIRAYLAEELHYGAPDLDGIPIQKDFLFVPSLENKLRNSSRLIVMSSIYGESRTSGKVRSFMRSVIGSRSPKPNLPDLIPAPHPVHWFCTDRYRSYLPDLWSCGKVNLVVLPKSTFVVRREISPVAVESLVASIRDAGMVPIACVYPDQHSLLAYHSILRLERYFDDVVVAGPVTSLVQMVKLLTYIDASCQVTVPQSDQDILGPLSIAAILGIYRGKYAALPIEDIHVFLNQSGRANKIVQRYPGSSDQSWIRDLSVALSSATSAQEQYDILRKRCVLDILPDSTLVGRS